MNFLIHKLHWTLVTIYEPITCTDETGYIVNGQYIFIIILRQLRNNLDSGSSRQEHFNSQSIYLRMVALWIFPHKIYIRDIRKWK
jgi:hypothetical protein